jgi:hypothetical protein
MLAPLSRSSLTISSLPSPAALIRAVESYWGRGQIGLGGAETGIDREEGIETGLGGTDTKVVRFLSDMDGVYG